MNWNTLFHDNRIRSYKRISSTNLRAEFEKDYHRIIGSASFRRLQDKTQALPLDKSNFVRTRFTHSLEMLSLTKFLGRNISESTRARIKDRTFLSEHKAAVCDILQCTRLTRDIENLPFGHSGETSIQDWFRQNPSRLDFKGRPIGRILEPQMLPNFFSFEDNTQAFRVVTRLHFLVDEHGMDPTRALLGTIIKYPVSFLEIREDGGDTRTKEIGYFYAGKDNFEDVQRSASIRGRCHPLTFFLKVMDDIAYKTTDVENAVKESHTSYDRLLTESEGFCANKQMDRYRQIISWSEERYYKGVERGYSGLDQYVIQNWITDAQGQMIVGITDCFTEHYGAIMGGTCGKDTFAGTGVELLMKALRDIAYRYTFGTKFIPRSEVTTQTILSSFLDRSVDGVIPWDTDLAMTQVRRKMVSLTSDNYRKIYSFCSKGRSEEEELYLHLLLVTSYICRMTDSYTKGMYQELNEIAQKAKPFGSYWHTERRS